MNTELERDDSQEFVVESKDTEVKQSDLTGLHISDDVSAASIEEAAEFEVENTEDYTLLAYNKKDNLFRQIGNFKGTDKDSINTIYNLISSQNDGALLVPSVYSSMSDASSLCDIARLHHIKLGLPIPQTNNFAQPTASKVNVDGNNPVSPQEKVQKNPIMGGEPGGKLVSFSELVEQQKNKTPILPSEIKINYEKKAGAVLNLIRHHASIVKKEKKFKFKDLLFPSVAAMGVGMFLPMMGVTALSIFSTFYYPLAIASVVGFVKFKSYVDHEEVRSLDKQEKLFKEAVMINLLKSSGTDPLSPENKKLMTEFLDKKHEDRLNNVNMTEDIRTTFYQLCIKNDIKPNHMAIKSEHLGLTQLVNKHNQSERMKNM